MTIVASAAWLVFAAAVVVRWTSAALPSQAVSAAAFIALGLALAAAGRSAASAWRGPEIRSFASCDAVRCDAADAAVVRAAAQLRGSLGGAGHVHPARLVLSALAWVAAAGSAGAALLDPGQGVVPLWGGVAVALSAMALVFPAHAFFYREAAGGGIVVHPRDARDAIIEIHAPSAADGRSSRATRPESLPGG